MKGHRFMESMATLDTVERWGTLRRITPTWLEADGPAIALGSLCEIGDRSGARSPMLAEVVKVAEDGIALVPFEQPTALQLGMRVRALAADGTVPVGNAFLGRAVDALGRPIDAGGPVGAVVRAPIHAELPTPLQRASSDEMLPTGIRAIDGLLTMGVGQRLGIFAASGVGKTTLISQLARQVEADCTVLCLVGERGREVDQFWSSELDEAGRRHTALVAATSDKPAALRVRAVYQALAMARHWREQGRKVLLILDSATRLAMAMREVGLASGEPPTIRAYPPSVFATIPRIVEQCGALKSGGSITALFTVLSETDEVDDPVCEMMKSILDGHIVLSRSLAERGHFPAIDITRSVSRNSDRLISRDQAMKARVLRALLADYEASRTLIESGLYKAGASSALDAAIAVKPGVDAFLAQPQDEAVDFDTVVTALRSAVGGVS